MFIGHFGVAFAAKRYAPALSLGIAVLAAQWSDLVWPNLVLLGVEHVRIAPGDTAFTPLEFVDYPWSHSLVAVLGWGVLLGMLVWRWRRDIDAAWCVGGLVVSHWLLDAISHRPDLPLAPGDDARIGLSLWDSIPATLLVEGALFAFGVTLYLRATRAKDAIGRFAPIALIALLLVAYAAAAFGPAPESIAQVAWTDQCLWLFVALAWWADAHRAPH